ncbi:MAG: ABC transporter permease [Spirochaetales bacterium]|nr:ABC transporter permease [Spirochaetales bacterium]MCF7938681.1 ABC transporter permease [Spirochaetales bacterium]
MPAEQSEVQESGRSFSDWMRTQSKRPTFGVALILLGLCLILSLSTENFLSQSNLFSVARAFSYIAIIAIGEAMVIISGGVDLSVGSIYGFGGLIGAIAMHTWGVPIALAIPMGIVVGGGIGAVNGLLITQIRMPPFIATLGMLSVVRGLSYAMTSGYPVRTPAAFNVLGQGYLGPIPLPVLYMVALAIGFTFFLNKTVLGRRIYAIGGNEEASAISGIRIGAVKMVVYILAGVLAAIAGLIATGRLGVAQSTAGLGYELDVVAAVIIGGASLTGGKGTILGAILGAAIMGVLRNGLVLLNVSAYWQQAVIGMVIISAIAADQLRQRRSY